MEDVTVVIGNLGQSKDLLPCLRSIFDTVTGQISLKVIVGFNFTGDSDTPQTLARDFPQAEQLRAPANLGYCRAYNQMMARSRSRYVLLLDDDTLLRAGTIEGMVRFMDDHPEVGIAGCRTVNPDGSYQKTTALMYNMRTEFINILRPSAFWRDGIDESVSTWKSVDWLNGHFHMVRTQTIEEVGLLDEHFYTAQHEADWCLRMHRAGWKVAYVPDYEVVHIRGEHSSAPGEKSIGNIIRSHLNRYYFMRKHYGDAAAHLFRAVMSLGAAVRLAKYATLWLVDRDRRPEAGRKIEAYTKIMLRGASARPEILPDDLRQKIADFTPSRPGIPT